MKKILLLAVLLLNVIILQAQGVYQMWGMTQSGGNQGAGVIYSTDATGNNFQLRHQFAIGNAGANPKYTQLVRYNNKFYGMTQFGGSSEYGVIFEWDPATNVYTDKFSFDLVNGSYPVGSLALHEGKFYGLASGGGTANGGVIFEWDPTTNIYLKKIDLLQTIYPTGSLIFNNGKFYGVTKWGAGNNGAIFEWDPTTNVYTDKLFFGTGIGFNPSSDLALFNGKFYGMVALNQRNPTDRSIFEWDPVTNGYTQRLILAANEGGQSLSGFTLIGSKFFGITYDGGINNKGVIFEWDPSTNLYTKEVDLDIPIGSFPTGKLTFNNGKLYGTTSLGGIYNTNTGGGGVIFEWDTTTHIYTKKIDLSDITGTNPNGTLTTDGGKFYGMTASGGGSGRGVIFEWDPVSNQYTKKIDLYSGDPNGFYPAGSLTRVGRKFYGMTNAGGINKKGVIFEYDAADNYTKKIDFDGSNGSSPYGSLFQLGGKLYGMTRFGGTNDKGAIFEFDTATNTFTKINSLNLDNGSSPYGSLKLNNGKFYGMTNEGGTRGYGVIFEWDPVTNIYSKKVDFTGSNGSNPYGSLTFSNGKFYGMTSGRGTDGHGLIFEWDPVTNQYLPKLLFDPFNINAAGSNPYGDLTLRGSKFYGMTFDGGRFDAGVIFEWDPVTNDYIKKQDLARFSGSYPTGSLTLSGNKFYGTANHGGSNVVGVIFEWDPATNVYSKKKDFTNIDGRNPQRGNDLITAPAPVAKGLPGNCASFPPVTIDNTNNNQWVSIVDELGNAVAEIKANGNNLGIVNTSMFINNGAVREDGTKKLYLDRNITITPQVQPITPVDLRLYIKSSEFEALKNALNSNGRPSGIVSIQDLVIYKIDGACAAAVSSVTNAVTTTSGAWEEDHVLSASIPSFSSFYFAGKGPAECPGPEIICNADTVLNAKAGACGAVVCYKPPAVTDVCGKATITQIAGLHSGAVFPVGCTINTFVATSSSGKKDTCSFKVTVKDKEAPHITQACANPNKLWPPNHKMKAVTISYKTWDNCGAVTSSLSVSSNEPVNGTGHGDKAPDWIVLDDHHVQLRAERTGRGGGRIYTITITSTDASGNTSTEKVKVEVPHQKPGWHRDNWGDDNDGYVDGNGDYHEYEFDCTVIPNPSKNYFIIQLKSVTNQKIEARLLDQNGKLISKLNTVKNQIRRFGDDLRPGVYMVEITQGEQRKTIKVIKQ